LGHRFKIADISSSFTCMGLPLMGASGTVEAVHNFLLKNDLS